MTEIASINERARESALIARDEFKIRPTSEVTYHSAGLVAVIADLESSRALGELPAPLQSIKLVTASANDVKGMPNAVAVAGRSLSLKGHLGAFTITIDAEQTQGKAETVRADIVLDLGGTALKQQALLPPGYIRGDLSRQSTEDLVEELSQMTGEFSKPRFFNYSPDLCAHGVNGATACTRCIDACPAEAISSIGKKVEVDPFLCQGGGICASVCPSGAMQYVLPRLADSGNRIRSMLKTYETQGGRNPVVMFHTEAQDISAHLQAHHHVLPIMVEEVASVGMDLCLSTLIAGASQVLLLIDEEVPAVSVKNLREQVSWASTLIAGLGLSPEQILITSNDGDDLGLLTDLPEITAAEVSVPNSKRQAIFQAVDHLYSQAVKRREMIDLPVGAPFGMASIDANACTLCMACVGSCPGKALQDGSNRQVPEVFFIESNCLQCGACTLTCPENAITISPRMVFDREKRNQSRMLNQDEPFACISCGKPFAPTTVIHKLSFRLQGHHMFQNERALNRLKMCEDCRVADIVQDDQAMNAQFDPSEKAERDLLS